MPDRSAGLPPSIIDTRRDQMFPTLDPTDLERVRRFGIVRSYGAGEALARVGEVGHGLIIILAGDVDITQHDQSGRRTLIVTYGPGAFMGELAQLAGRPALYSRIKNKRSLFVSQTRPCILRRRTIN